MDKAQEILIGAEKVFERLGYKNTKVQDIALETGYSKVTIYAYYESKANLYMAVAYKAMQTLIDALYETLNETKNGNGLEVFMKLSERYIDFCVSHLHYMELLLEYMQIVRRVLSGEKNSTSEEFQNTIFYKKLKNIQNITMNLVVDEIKRGQKDGSIKNMENPWLIHHIMWSMIVGYAKVNYNPSADLFIHASNQKWREALLQILFNMCQDNLFMAKTENN